MQTVVQFPGNLSAVEDNAALRQISSTTLAAKASYISQGQAAFGDGQGGIYAWDPASLASDDDKSVLRPADRTPLQAGRWVAAVGAGTGGGPKTVAVTLADLKAAPPANVTTIYDGAPFTWTAGNFTGQADDINVVKQDDTPLSSGAWIRQSASQIRTSTGLTVQQALDSVAGGQVITLTANATIPVYDPKTGDAYQLNGFTLTIQSIADSAMSNIFRGTGRVVIQSGIARPEWWEGVSYRKAAIALSEGGGGTVLLRANRYVSESSGSNPIPIANVAFVGETLPVYGPGFTQLLAGTILNGPVVVASQTSSGSQLGQNVRFETLGVDSGSFISGSATGIEGLVLPNIGPGNTPNAAVELRTGIVVRNVRVLCKSAGDAGHGILIESAINPLIDKCETVYGGTGIVLKTRGGTVSNCLMRGHNVAPGLAKSDAYAICTDTVWDNCKAASITGADTGPFRVQAATAGTSNHIFRNTQASGTTQWVSIESLSTFNATDITVSGGFSEATRFGSITVSRINSSDTGVIQRVTISAVRINNVLELVTDAEYIGAGIYIGAACSTVTVSGVQITNTAGDGVRNRGEGVLVTGCNAINPGSGYFSYNGVAGSMKVPASSNIGSTNGSVVTS